MERSSIRLNKSRVVFDESTHTYSLDGKPLKGITGTLIRRAFPQKYKDVPGSVLAHAADRGHKVHEAIEFHDRFGTEADTEILRVYEALKKENGLTAIDNEYLVSDEKNYASSIDIVDLNKANEICITDTKTTFKLDKPSVSLQTSIYKKFFEMQNPGLVVKHLYGLWIRVDDDGNVLDSGLFELPIVAEETIDALIKADLADKPFEYHPVPDWYGNMESEYARLLAEKNKIDGRLTELKDGIMENMESEKISQIKTGLFTVSYLAAKTGKRFDSALFKKENKELYDKYQKESMTSATLRMLPVKQQDNE
jgi:hypothetical protein